MDTGSPVTIMWVLFVLVPLLMAFLTFVVPEVPGRWVNGILGVASAVRWFPAVPTPASRRTDGASA